LGFANILSQNRNSRALGEVSDPDAEVTVFLSDERGRIRPGLGVRDSLSA